MCWLPQSQRRGQVVTYGKGADRQDLVPVPPPASASPSRSARARKKTQEDLTILQIGRHSKARQAPIHKSSYIFFLLPA